MRNYFLRRLVNFYKMVRMKQGYHFAKFILLNGFVRYMKTDHLSHSQISVTVHSHKSQGMGKVLRDYRGVRDRESWDGFPVHKTITTWLFPLPWPALGTDTLVGGKGLFPAAMVNRDFTVTCLGK